MFRNADHHFMFRAIALTLRARLRRSRSASAAARSIKKKVGFAAFFLMPQPPLLFQEGSDLRFRLSAPFAAGNKE
jgi:hypothetical protein